MSRRWGVIIAIAAARDPSLNGPVHAEHDVVRGKAILELLSIPAPRQIVLAGPHATHSTIAARIKSLKRRLKPDDQMVLIVSGRTVNVEKQILLACWDTLPDDPAETAIPFVELPRLLRRGERTPLIAFLDLAGEGVPESVPENAAYFQAHDDGQETWSHGNPPQSLWSECVRAALMTTSGQSHVTLKRLAESVATELARSLRKTFGPAARQNIRFSSTLDDGFILRDGSSAAGGETTFTRSELSRLTIRGETRTRFKALSGYRKTHQIPTRATAAANQFTMRLAGEEIAADLAAIFDRARREFGYKRTDIDSLTDRDGTGTIRTADFQYLIRAELDPSEPSMVLWHREVSQLSDLAFVRRPAFAAAFGEHLDRIIFEWDTPFNVAELIDRLEANPPKGVQFHPSADGQSCDLTLAGLSGKIRVSSSQLEVRGKASSTSSLLDLFLTFLHRHPDGTGKTSLAIRH